MGTGGGGANTPPPKLDEFDTDALADGVAGKFGGGVEAGLVGNVVFMELDGTGGDTEDGGDLLHGFAFGEELEDFAFAGGEVVVGGRVPGEAQVDFGGDAGGNESAAGEGVAKGGEEFLGGGMFEDIAEGAEADGACGEGDIGAGGDEDEAGREMGREAVLKSVESIEQGHGDVAHGEFGMELIDGGKKSTTVLDGGHEFKVSFKDTA